MMSIEAAKDRLQIPRSGQAEGNMAAHFNLSPGRGILAALPATNTPDKLDIEGIHWGFLPSWQKSPSKQVKNARLDKASGAFWRKAFTRRRTVIPANWWYEWVPDKGGKQPYAIRPKAAGVEGYFFAGVWGVAKGLPEDHKLAGKRTTAIITTEAHPDIEHIHHRMPVTLTDAGARAWLEEGDDLEDLTARLEAGLYDGYEFEQADKRLNKPANNDNDLVSLEWQGLGDMPEGSRAFRERRPRPAE